MLRGDWLMKKNQKLVRHDEGLNYTWEDAEARKRFKRERTGRTWWRISWMGEKGVKSGRILLMETDKGGGIGCTWVFRRRWVLLWQSVCLQNTPRGRPVGFEPKAQERIRVRNRLENYQVTDEFVGVGEAVGMQPQRWGDGGGVPKTKRLWRRPDDEEKVVVWKSRG